MKNQVVLALFVSLLLVGAATWMRLANSSADEVAPSLVAVDHQTNESETDLGIFLNSGTSTNTQRNLSNTDLVSRQLLLDYINLASDGQATGANIASLAEKYVENIPALTTAPAISLSDLKVAPDSKIAFQQYEAELNNTHKAFADRMSKTSTGKNINVLGPAFYSFASALSSSYTDAANKLKVTSVPKSVASAHMRLINSYYSSAVAMKALAQTEEDPAVAFAGIAAMSANLNRENFILSEISGILISNGI